MIELENPQIEPVERLGTYAKYEISPLQAGYGVTLGNTLRRVLLSSLEGAAVTSLQIRDVYHEFSTIPGVKEDVTQIVLNVKKLRLKCFAAHPVQLRLVRTGAGPVTAADITESAEVEIVNPEQHIMTIDSGDVTIEVDLTVERGVGYLAAERAEPLPIGVIPVDAIFSPVRKVNYKVEHTRVGQATNYDKLNLEVWTDGTISGVEAVSKSADILVEQFRLFSQMGRPALPVVERGLGAGVQLTPDRYNMAIEDLNLSMRAYNCLRRSGLMTVGQVLEKSEEELLALRNFGRKSYDELRERLDELGLLAADRGEELLAEALPLDGEETPLSARRVIAEPEEEEAPAPVEAVAEAPARAKKVSKAKAAKAGAAAEGEEEEMPDWKRKLLALTGEAGEEGA